MGYDEEKVQSMDDREKQNSKDNIIPCSKSPEFSALINTFANELRQAAYTIGSHGLTEEEFIESGLFDAAIERLRGKSGTQYK